MVEIVKEVSQIVHAKTRFLVKVHDTCRGRPYNYQSYLTKVVGCNDLGFKIRGFDWVLMMQVARCQTWT